MQGILVHGSNHFIVNGPLPSAARARALVRQWEIPEIGAPQDTGLWSICTKAFRENLSWAVVLRSDSDITSAIEELLRELRARGVSVQQAAGPWLPRDGVEAWEGVD